MFSSMDMTIGQGLPLGTEREPTGDTKTRKLNKVSYRYRKQCFKKKSLLAPG